MATDLRPYILPGRPFIRAVITGSATLGLRIHRSRRLRARLARIKWGRLLINPATWFVGVSLTIGTWSLIGAYVVIIGSTGAVVWVVLALMHSTPQPAAEQASSAPVNEAPEAADDAPEEGDEEDPREAFLDHLRRAIGNRNGILLRDLAQQPPLDRCGIPGIRAIADHHGVPIRSSIKVAGSTSVGIARADLPPLPQEDPQETPLAG